LALRSHIRKASRAGPRAARTRDVGAHAGSNSSGTCDEAIEDLLQILARRGRVPRERASFDENSCCDGDDERHTRGDPKHASTRPTLAGLEGNPLCREYTTSVTTTIAPANAAAIRVTDKSRCGKLRLRLAQLEPGDSEVVGVLQRC
jgi:hypothetical protein